MTTPKWLSTTLSFILVALILVAYVVTHVPPKNPTQSAAVTPDTVSNTTPPMNVTSHPVFDKMLTIGTVPLQVAYATTPAEQEQGLSYTAPLADNNGMLFIFPQENMTGFWMKDMNYPLDIIWIGADKTVKDITPNLAPSTYPATFAPKSLIQYVLEVPAGFAAKNNIVTGTQVTF